MIKAFKYRFYPNQATEKKLHWTLTRCRELYNAALCERKDAYQQYQRTVILQGADHTVAATMVAGFQVKPMSFFGQKRDLVDLKEERPEYQEIASHVLQDVLHRLDKAFSAFFRRIRNGETPGYPRFKGRNRYNSFTYPDGAGWKFDGQFLDLKVQLNGTDTLAGTCHFEIHVPEMIFQAHDISDQDMSFLIGYKPDGDTGHRIGDRYAGVHERQRPAAYRGHTRRAVRF